MHCYTGYIFERLQAIDDTDLKGQAIDDTDLKGKNVTDVC